MHIIYLKPSEEIFILNELRDIYPLSNGSSRVVYDCPDSIARRFNLTTECVIKVGCGPAGYNQNQAEIDMFEAYGNEHLANIFYAGSFVLIMERVDEISEWFRDCGDDYDIDNEDALADIMDATGCSVSEIHRIYATFSWLNEMLGYTSDNFQLGTDSEGYAVAFDYGFYADHGDDTSTRIQIGEESSAVANDIEYQKQFFKFLITALGYFDTRLSPTEAEYVMDTIDEWISLIEQNNGEANVKSSLSFYLEHQDWVGTCEKWKFQKTDRKSLVSHISTNRAHEVYCWYSNQNCYADEHVID